MNVDNIALLITIIGGLVAVTNVITQVIKKATWDKLPTNILVLIISEVLTLCCGFTYMQVKSIPIEWYLVVGQIVLGFLVSYAAMFGFDKLKEVMGWHKQ